MVSAANRRLADYENAVIERAADYGINWFLIVDPDTSTVRWWNDGTESNAGPEWVANLDIAAVLRA